MSLYEAQLAKIDRTKQFKADTQNTELMLTRHFNKITGNNTSGTENVFVNKSTGQRSHICQTCNFDVYAGERGIDLNRGFDIVKNPVGQGFNIRQADLQVSLSPEKLTNIRSLISSRETMFEEGISSSFHAGKDSSITVNTSIPASNIVNTQGLGVSQKTITTKSSSPRSNQQNLNSVQNKDVIYGDESLETEKEKKSMDNYSQSLLHYGGISGVAIAGVAIGILLLSRRKKKK